MTNVSFSGRQRECTRVLCSDPVWRHHRLSFTDDYRDPTVTRRFSVFRSQKSLLFISEIEVQFNRFILHSSSSRLLFLYKRTWESLSRLGVLLKTKLFIIPNRYRTFCPYHRTNDCTTDDNPNTTSFVHRIIFSLPFPFCEQS